METVADFHVHSLHSIATGRNANLEHLDLWGRYKGLAVVGTGLIRSGSGSLLPNSPRRRQGFIT